MTYNDDVLFIHVPKCAGRSVKAYMLEVLDGVVSQDDTPGKFPMGHMALRDIEEWTGRTPGSFRKIIAVVRNPYEQQFSYWNFWRDRFARGGVSIQDHIAASHSNLTSFLLDPLCDFDLRYDEHPGERRYINEGRIPNYTSYGGLWMYWLAIDGVMPQNLEVIKHEEISTALPKALRCFTEVNLPLVPWLNATPHKPAIDYYTTVALRLVEHKCEWAFDNFYERLSEKE